MKQRPLRVNFVLTSLPVGGAETLLLNLIRGMDRTRFSPEVVCLKEPGELGSEFEKLAPVHSRMIGSKFDVGVLLRLKRLFQENLADAVITVGAGDKMFWGRIAARWARVPVICSALHSTGWPDGVGRMNRWLTPLTDGFIAVASKHAGHLIRHERFPADRVFMIPNGVDCSRFVPDVDRRAWLRRSLDLPLDSQVVVIVAALREEKNHSQFIEAACNVIAQTPKAHFVIVGDGPERSRIESEIAGAGLVSHFHLLGSRQDTPAILAGSDVFCLTSKNEANPVSILEALACGIPVVSPNVGSIAETVLPEKTGVLTRPLDAEDTASGILRLLRDPERANELGMNGRRLVESTWSLEAMVEGYQSLVERLYNQKARRLGRECWNRREVPASTTSNGCSPCVGCEQVFAESDRNSPVLQEIV